MKKFFIFNSLILFISLVFSQNFEVDYLFPENKVDNPQFSNSELLLNNHLQEIERHEQYSEQSSIVRANQQDSLILVGFYNSTNGANWTNKWTLTNPVSTWYGVTLDENGRVKYLNMSFNQLSGSIPNIISGLTNIERLYLNNNQLSGSIPYELSNLSNLKYFYLSNNQLTGSIPAQFGNLTNLQYFGVSTNQLTGSIPYEIGNLINLKELSLANNQLSGSIPASIGNLSNLTTLYLHNNQLSGQVPSEIGNLTNLLYLYANNNQLSGSLPSSIGLMTKLYDLILNNNLLSGTLPSEIANMTNLTWLYLNNNQISGLPNMGALTKLENCIINNNKLDFGDLLYSYITASYEYTYAPQDSIPRQVVVIGQQVTIIAVCNGNANEYQWYRNSEELSGQTNASITVSLFEDANYTCKVTNPFFPSLTLYSKAYNPEHPTASNDTKNVVSLYPNPSSDFLFFNLNEIDSYKIFDFRGVEVLSGGNANKIDINTIPAGIYTIRYSTNGEINHQKFVKQ